MYLIFGGECYYGHGGANDLLCSYSGDMELAISKAESFVGTEVVIDEDLDNLIFESSSEIQWVHVFDIESNAIVHRSEAKPYGDPSE